LDVRDGALDAGPVALEEVFVVRRAVVVGDGPDVLAVAVVLGDGVGAAAVYDAGDLAAVELVGAEPVDPVLYLAGVAAGEERGGGHRAVAGPGALVGARAGLDSGAVSVDEDVGELALEGVGDPLVLLGDGDGGAGEFFVPGVDAGLAAGGD